MVVLLEGCRRMDWGVAGFAGVRLRLHPDEHPIRVWEGRGSASSITDWAVGSGFGLARRKNHEDLVEQIATAHSCVALRKHQRPKQPK